MPAQWLACPYRREHHDNPPRPGRYLVVRDYLGAPAAGVWNFFECGGGPGTSYILGVGIAKIVDPPAALLAEPGVQQFPAALTELGTLLSVVNKPTRNTIERTLTKSLGYTDTEIDGWLGIGTPQEVDIGTKTLGELFDFLTTRWYRVVYEPLGSQAADGSSPGEFPGVVACDGRTTSTGSVSEPWTPLPRTPAEVAASVPSG